MRSLPVSRRAVQRFRLIALSSVGSVKIKLLLGFCILFTLILLACRVSTFMPWKQHYNFVSQSDFHRKGFTLLINTWKRNDLLKKSISHYAACPQLDSIHIVWSEPDPPSESLVRHLEHVVQTNSKNGQEIELKFDVNEEDNLNNRFKEIKNLKTDVVFSIDDDIIFPCSSVELAFSVWQSAPDTMVGFVPRMHWLDRSIFAPVNLKLDLQSGSRDYYVYRGWWSVWWMGTYSMVLSKAAFFSQKVSGNVHKWDACIH